MIKFAKKHRVGIFFYFFILIYQFAIVNNGYFFSTNTITYAYHAVDYSMGFCTKILPGAIYNALVGAYNNVATTIYVTVLYLAFLILLSFSAELFYNKFSGQYQTASLILLFLFLTGPFTFGIFIWQFGMLDFYWILFFALAYFCLRNKYLKYLTPIFVFAIVLTYYSSVICYVSLLLLIILYYAFNAGSVKERNGYLIVFAASLFLAVGSTLYFLICETSNLTYTVDEFNNILTKERNVEYLLYYDFAFYKNVSSENVNAGLDFSSPSIGNLINIISFQFKTISSLIDLSDHYFLYILAAILFAFLCYILVLFIKSYNSKLKKIIALFMLILFFVCIILGLCFSTDIVRWLAHAFICLFIAVLTIIYFDSGNQALERVEKIVSKNKAFVLVFCIVYALTSVNPYS